MSELISNEEGRDFVDPTRVEMQAANPETAQPKNVMEKFRDLLQEKGGKYILPTVALLGLFASQEVAMAKSQPASGLEIMKAQKGIEMFLPVYAAAELHIDGARMTPEGIVSSKKEVNIDPNKKLGDMYYETKGFDGEFADQDVAKALQDEEKDFHLDIEAACGADEHTAHAIEDQFDVVKNKMWPGKPGEHAHGVHLRVVKTSTGETTTIEDQIPVTWMTEQDSENKVSHDINPLIGELLNLHPKQRAEAIRRIVDHDYKMMKLGIEGVMRNNTVK